jgi:hypothetical protein
VDAEYEQTDQQREKAEKAIREPVPSSGKSDQGKSNDEYQAGYEDPFAAAHV